MLIDPICWKRKCKYYIGVIQPDDNEQTEKNACFAFPLGIPENIAYGNNKHLKPTKEQTNSIVFERK